MPRKLQVRTERSAKNTVSNPENFQIKKPKGPVRFVRVDAKTLIEVPSEVSDMEAIERWEAKRNSK